MESAKQTPPIEGQPVSVPWDLFDLVYRVLMHYANYTTYQAPRIGGVLKGCPRGPDPTPPQLASDARWTIRRIDMELLARTSDFKEDEAGVFKQRDELLAALKRMPRALAERGMEDARVCNDHEAWNAFLYFLDPASFGGERLERVLAFLKRIEDERGAAIAKAEGRGT